MFKKSKNLISSIILITILLGNFINVFAIAKEEYNFNSEEIKYLNEKNILIGNAEGDLMLDKGILRRDSIIILSRLLGKENLARKTIGQDKWKDTKEIEYYKPFFKWVEDEGYFIGVSEEKLEPNREITANEFSLVMLRALGYEDVNYKQAFNRIGELGLTSGLAKRVKGEEILLRGDMATIIYNSLYTKNNEGKYLGLELGLIKKEDIKNLEVKSLELKREKTLTKKNKLMANFKFDNILNDLTFIKEHILVTYKGKYEKLLLSEEDITVSINIVDDKLEIILISDEEIEGIGFTNIRANIKDKSGYYLNEEDIEKIFKKDFKEDKAKEKSPIGPILPEGGSGGDSGSEEKEKEKTKYTVSFKIDDDIIKKIEVEEGEKINKPKEIPIKENYIFDGWSLDGEEFNFDTLITKDLELVGEFEVAKYSFELLEVNTILRNEILLEALMNTSVIYEIMLEDNSIQINGFNPDYLGSKDSIEDFVEFEEKVGRPIVAIGNNAFWKEEFLKSDFQKLEKLNCIGENAFYSSKFTGDFECPSLKMIGYRAFMESKFDNKFNCSNIETIGGYAFYNSIFKGEFNHFNIKNIGHSSFWSSNFRENFKCPNIEYIGNSAFWKSKFDGKFNSPKVKIIAAHAFQTSLFIGDFSCPVLEEIGSNAFNHSKFDGIFEAPEVQKIGIRSFEKSIFKGEFNCDKIESIGMQAFCASKFKGGFECEYLESIGDNAFRESEFSEGFKCNSLKEVEAAAFFSSKFTKNFECEALEKIGNYTFKNSTFTGSFNCPLIEEISIEAFENSKFKGEFNCSSIRNIGIKAFKNSELTGEFNGPKIIEVGASAFENSKFDKEFVAPELKSIGKGRLGNGVDDPGVPDGNVFTNSKFKGEFNCPNIEYIGPNSFEKSNFNPITAPDGWDGIIEYIKP